MRVPVLVTLLLAGCAGPAAELAPVAGLDPPDPRGPETTSVPVDLAVASPNGDTHDVQKGDFPIPEGATHVVVEARWTCRSPTCSFSLNLLVDGEPWKFENGEGSASIVSKAPPAGRHEVALVSRGPAVGMSGEIRATAFFAQPPEDWTAFPGT